MPRPRKHKRICRLPEISSFGPTKGDCTDTVNLSVEEYETVRLIDHEGLDQEECSQLMGVARSTVQRLYTDARKKIADCIIGGKTLTIGGGDWELCDQPGNMEICTRCHRHHGRHGCPPQ